MNRLTDAEKTILNSALQEAIDNADPATGLYFKDIANYHGSPTTICGGSPCCPHGLHGFLSWHRLFTGTYFTPSNSEIICGQNVSTKVVCGKVLFSEKKALLKI